MEKIELLDKADVIQVAEKNHVEFEPVKTSETTEKVQHYEEMMSQLRLKEAEAKHKRIKDLLLNIVGLVIILVALGTCIWMLFRENSTPEDKILARTLLTTIIAGFIGFVTGKANKDKD
jgi:hypothetical protein